MSGDSSAPRYQPLRPPRHAVMELRGLNTQLTHWGPVSDSPIFLLHGFQDCGATFQFLIDALPADWSFTALDFRGFGGSEGRDDCYWFPDYFADLDALLQRHSPGKPARLLGHSMGANVAMLYAGIRQALVRWVISLEGFGLPRSTPLQAPQRLRQWLDQLQRGPGPRSRYPSAAALAEKLLARNPRLAKSQALFVAEAWTRAVDDGVELRFDPWHRLTNPVLQRREEVDAIWREVTAPVLMVLAENSEYTPRLGQDFDPNVWREMLPSLRLASLPDCGHMMHHERPELLAKVVYEFVTCQET